MRFLLLIMTVFLLGISPLNSQNLIDSIIKISNSYDDIHLKIDFLKRISKEKKFDTISMILLEEAKIYASAYRLPMDVEIYKSLGEKYTSNFMFQQAINVYDSLKNHYQKVKDLENMALSIDEMARNYLRAAKQDSALECYLRAEKIILKTNNDLLKFRINFNLAHFYLLSSPAHSLANAYLRVCSQLAEKLDDDSLRIEFFMEMGRLHVYSENYDSADFYFTETQKLIDKHGGYHKIDQFYNSLAVYYQLKGNNDLALEYYNKSYAINKKNKNYIGLYVNSYNLHNFYVKAKDIVNAEKYLLLGLEYANITHIEQYKIATYEQLHQFFASNNNFQKAYEYLILMNKSVESMHYKEWNTKIADLSIQYDVLKTQDEVKFLTQENQIQSLKIRNDKLIIFGLLILIMGSALYFVLIFRQNRIKTKQKTDELTLKNLIQQMNPHFIFNTLNSIQYYMYNHSELDTNDYISKFAALIRKILDNSNVSNISLSEEIETVKLYIELERLRFNQSFDYQINMSDKLNAEDIKIPSMFIQPFVENAIVHGLRHRGDQGQLNIDFVVLGDILECTISDNGIGRNQSDSINKLNAEKHNSMAITIANERIKLLSSVHNKKLSVKFFDKTHGDDFCGTKVIIELPIIKS